MTHKFGIQSKKGPRKNNQDAVRGPLNDPKRLAQSGVLYLLADGMGGYQGGEVASNMALKHIEHYFYQHSDPIPQRLEKALYYAHDQIRAQAQQDSSLRGMGTTAVVIAVKDGQFYVANVGDSPAWLIRDGKHKEVSTEHSWVAQQIKAGTIKPENARQHKLKNVLTMALGMEEEHKLRPAVNGPIPVREGDVLVVMSDGVSNLFEPQEIINLVAHYGTNYQAAADELVDEAIKRKSRDNCSALVIPLLPASSKSGIYTGRLDADKPTRKHTAATPSHKATQQTMTPTRTSHKQAPLAQPTTARLGGTATQSPQATQNKPTSAPRRQKTPASTPPLAEAPAPVPPAVASSPPASGVPFRRWLALAIVLLLFVLGMGGAYFFGSNSGDSAAADANGAMAAQPTAEPTHTQEPTHTTLPGAPTSTPRPTFTPPPELAFNPDLVGTAGTQVVPTEVPPPTQEIAQAPEPTAVSQAPAAPTEVVSVGQPAPAPTQPVATATRQAVVPTQAPVATRAPTNTPVPTATQAPVATQAPAATEVFPTAAPEPPTVAPTEAPILPTATPIPPTATSIQPTATTIPATATPIPPTTTPIPPTPIPTFAGYTIAPQPISPINGEVIRSQEVLFQWGWNGQTLRGTDQFVLMGIRDGQTLELARVDGSQRNININMQQKFGHFETTWRWYITIADQNGTILPNTQSAEVNFGISLSSGGGDSGDDSEESPPPLEGESPNPP